MKMTKEETFPFFIPNSPYSRNILPCRDCQKMPLKYVRFAPVQLLISQNRSVGEHMLVGVVGFPGTTAQTVTLSLQILGFTVSLRLGCGRGFVGW